MASTTMEHHSLPNKHHQPPPQPQPQPQPEFNLREWSLKAKLTRENTNSRRYSASYIRSFREDTRSFRSNITISSTASSPGYSLKDEIDPSTYSFTTALKALQARTVYNNWECLSPDGFALNSKWNEAEKYICNPLSGEVPMECLSAKTLSGRSFRNLTNRITMSAPLVYSTSHPTRQIQTKAMIAQQDITQLPILEEKENQMDGTTRDVGTQSTPLDLSSDSLSPTRTPSIVDRSFKRFEPKISDSPNSDSKVKDEEQMQVTKVGEKKEEESKRDSNKKKKKKEKEEEEEEDLKMCRQGGCLSWMRKRQREKHKPTKFPFHLKSCN